MARSTKKKTDSGDKGEKQNEAPITHGEVNPANPSGIEKVSDEHAQHLGGLVGFGGPGAAGAVVAGPAVHVATEGGTKPLPVANLPEDVETSGGAEAGDQETSQAAALESGNAEDTGETQTPAQDQGAGEPANDDE